MSVPFFGKEEHPRVVNLTNEDGQEFAFAVIQAFDFEGGDYMLAMTESFPDQLVIIERKGHDLSLVLEEARLLALQAHLEKLAAAVQTITVQDEAGKEYSFQIVHQIEHEGQNYLLGIDVNGGTELVAFRAGEDSVAIETDEAILAELQIKLQADRVMPPEQRITLETESGEMKEFSVIGQLEIHGKEYVIAASLDIPEQLLALAFDGENLSIIEDEAEREHINSHIQQLRQGHEVHG